MYSPENIDNIIALEYKHSKLDGRSIVIKKMVDLLAALLLLILVSPLMLLVAIAIKIESR